MKKTQISLLSALILLFALDIQAQDALTLGNRIIGGGMSFRLSESDHSDQYNNGINERKNESSSFSISPYYGRLVEDNKLLGISLSIGSSNSENDYYYGHINNNSWIYPSVYSDHTKFIGTGIFIRWYFPVSQRAGIYFQPGANYNYIKEKSDVTYYSDSTRLVVRDLHSDLSRSHDLSIRAKVGLYFFLFDQLSIETNLGNFVANLQFTNNEFKRQDVEGVQKDKDKFSNINMNLANSFTFDQLFTINYYF